MILIILLVSAVALPVVLPALSHRQMSEAARMLQGALAGARDSAIHNQLPSGIRLLPDPTFNGVNPTTGLLDATQPLAANRIIPIESAPPYSEGRVSVVPQGGMVLPFSCIVIQEWVVNTAVTPVVPNAPTSWYWNIRVGDKVQINNAGPWYTIVGPTVVDAAGGNAELFVNVGVPGTASGFHTIQGGIKVQPEFLFLVNGEDDNNNGWIDEGFDNVDNDGDGLVDETTCTLFPLTGEWEPEHLKGSLAQAFPPNLQYTIQRRPAPAANSREQALPSNVVIDLTTWGNGSLAERSRLPVNPFTGAVDILVYPSGAVVPTTIYSTPASFTMAGAFFHFWLAERGDVIAPSATATAPPFLPVGTVPQQLGTYTGQSLQGEYRVVSMFTHTGQITNNDNVQFDNPSNPASGTFNASYPFLPAQQGNRGGP